MKYGKLKNIIKVANMYIEIKSPIFSYSTGYINIRDHYCLVVGYKTPDFLTLEKERLFTIYHGCIQELSRKNDRLEAENVAKIKG